MQRVNGQIVRGDVGQHVFGRHLLFAHHEPQFFELLVRREQIAFGALGENLELINLRAIAGEYDSQARHIDIGKLPVLIENQQKGNYRVYLDPSDQGADVGLFCNQSYEKDAEVAKWLSTRNFRIALSHGIDRR